MILYTGGCSFTNLYWPTWANYLGHHYEKHVQCGKAGACPSVIARSILNNNIEPGSHVAVMWTGYDRFPIFKDNQWHNLGSVMSDTAFYKRFYHPYERFLALSDAIRLLYLDSKVRQYELFHYSAFPWMLGEIESKVDDNICIEAQNIISTIPNFHMNNNLEDFHIAVGKIWINHYYFDNDDHPSPTIQWQWLKSMQENLPVQLDIPWGNNQSELDQKQVLNNNLKDWWFEQGDCNFYPDHRSIINE